MNRFVRSTLANSPHIAIVAACVCIPPFISSQYFIQVMIFIGIYIILTLSLNLLNGYVGLLSIGHAALYAIRAYASAKLMMEVGLPWLVVDVGGGDRCPSRAWVSILRQ